MSSNLVYGIHAVKAVLERHPQQVMALYVQKGRDDHRVQAILDLAEAASRDVHYVSRKELDERTQNHLHQGVVAMCEIGHQYHEHDLQGLLEALPHPPFLLILDGVTDPHNLGACLRTADAVGVDAIIAPKDNAVGLTPVVRKTASGAAEVVPFIQVTNLARTMRFLKEQNIWLYGTSDDAEQTLYEVKLTGPLALVMGAEGKGMRRLTREHCDVVMHIPMQGVVSSLNVSVAAAVCLFEAVRQRV